MTATRLQVTNNAGKRQLLAVMLALLSGLAVLAIGYGPRPLVLLAAAASVVMLVVAPYAIVGLHFGGASETLRYLMGGALPHGLAALITASVLLCVLRKGRINRATISLTVISQLALVILMFASIQWASDTQEAVGKFQGFIVCNMLALLAPLLILTSQREAVRVMGAFGVGAAMLTALVWSASASGPAGPVKQLTGYNIESIMGGRIAGLGALIAIFWIWQARGKMRWALPALVGILAFFAYSLIAVQTRGAVAAFVVGMMVFATCTWVYLRRPGAAWLTIVAGIAFAIVAYLTLPPWFIARYSDPLSTAARRLMLFKESWEMFLAAPLLGNGIGSTEYLLGIWSHNLFLETAAELGLAGLVLLMFLLATALLVALRTLKRARGDYQLGVLMSALLACFTFSVVEAQVSANIVGNYLIWFFAGMILAVATSSQGDNRSRKDITLGLNR